MPFDFPDSPVLGDVITVPGGPSYSYDGIKWTFDTSAISSPPTPSVQQVFIGTMDAETAVVDYTVISGYPDGALLPASGVVVGNYVIVKNAGTPPVGTAPPEVLIPLLVGDWLISDGTVWVLVRIPAALGGSMVYTEDAPPPDAPPNSLWWDSDSGNMFVSYKDADSTQWVQVNATTAGPATVTVADFAPIAPIPNMLWWNSNDSNMYLWHNDGTSTQWVQISGDSVSQLPLSGGKMQGCISWSPTGWSTTGYDTHLMLNQDAGYRMGISATTNGRFNYMVENNNNYHSFFVGGIEQFQVGLNGINVFGNPFVGGGISFGALTVGTHDDFSKHICLYGSPNNGFGFTVSSNTLNYCCSQNTNVHNFWGADELFAQITQSGLIPKSGGFVMPSESEEIAAFAPHAIGSSDDGSGKISRTYRVDQVLEAAVAKIKQLEAEIELLKNK